MAAGAMLVQQRPPRLPRHVHIAPMHDRHDHRMKAESLFGEAVLVAPGPRLIGNAGEHACLDQLPEPVGEDVAGKSAPPPERPPPAPPPERNTPEQDGPPRPHHPPRGGGPARVPP